MCLLIWVFEQRLKSGTCVACSRFRQRRLGLQRSPGVSDEVRAWVLSIGAGKDRQKDELLVEAAALMLR